MEELKVKNYEIEENTSDMDEELVERHSGGFAAGIAGGFLAFVVIDGGRKLGRFLVGKFKGKSSKNDSEHEEEETED